MASTLGMPVQPLPRRRFPDGSLGPEPGKFFGRYGRTGCSWSKYGSVTLSFNCLAPEQILAKRQKAARSQLL